MGVRQTLQTDATLRRNQALRVLRVGGPLRKRLLAPAA